MRLFLVLLLAPLAACVTRSERWSEAYAHYAAGRLEEAERRFTDAGESGAVFLAGAEAGMVAWSAGRHEAALEHLARAAETARELEERGRLSPELLGESLVRLFVTERGTAYPGEGYERVQVHVLAALAYLARGRLESAWVEMRRADALLSGEEQLYEVRYAAGGLGHYLSGVLYELAGKPDEAWIDYRRMLDKGVGPTLAGRALVRLAPELGRGEELLELERRFGPAASLPEHAASVVLIAGVGEAPRKVETAVSVPLPEGYVRWAVPSFEPLPQPVRALRLEAGSTQVRTAVVEDVAEVARKNLDDRIAWLALRSGVRAYLKYELARELQRQLGGFGWLLGALFSEVTERADLRSWRTLPSSWQAARLFLPAGRHVLAVQAEGGGRVLLGEYELVPGETLFVLARALGPHLWVHPLGGERVRGAGSALPHRTVSGTMGAP